MRIEVNIPNDLLGRLDAEAARMRCTREEAVAVAVLMLAENQQTHEIKCAQDRLFATDDGEPR